MLIINDSNSPNSAFDESKLTFNFQRYFFNEKEHLQNQGGERLLTFYWQNTDYQSIEARFSVIIQDGVAYSPLRATFGGIEFSEEISEERLLEFLTLSVPQALACISSHIPIQDSGTFSPIQAKAYSTFIINAYPESYLVQSQIQKLEDCLFKLGFEISITEQNYEIPISNKTFYETMLSPRAKQLLKKSIRKGFLFQEVSKPDFSEIHIFIAHSRERKNRPMTMNLRQFENHFILFPKNFQAFSVKVFEQMIAVGVTIKINEEIIYTFYLADDEEYLKDSPTIFLLSGIYDYYKQQNFKILDLGIASEKGILNEGLAKFKRSLGGSLSLKKTYIKHFKTILK